MKRVLIITLILASMLTCLFGCSKNPLVTARREELQRMTQYMIDNSGGDGVTFYDSSSKPSRLILYFYGVDSIDVVDNMVTALNTYLEENEDCTYGLDHTRITVCFYDTNPNESKSWEQKFVGSVRNWTWSEFDNEIELKDGFYYLDIDCADSLYVSEFANLNNLYIDIHVPGTLRVDDSDALLEIEGLEKFCVVLVVDTGVNYDNYVQICQMTDYINESYGSRLVSVYRDDDLMRIWRQEYGDNLVEPAYMNSEG